jgi:hypothetical protein
MGRDADQGRVVEDDAAVARREQTRDGLEGGRLSRAVVAEQRHDLPIAHLEVDPAQGVDLAVVDVEVLNAEHGCLADGRGRPR